MDVDRRQPDRHASHLAFCHAHGPTAGQEADVGRGAAHVERDRVREARAAREQTRPDDAARRTRHEQPCRVRRRLLGRQDTAGREHHDRLRQPGLGRSRRQRAQVAGRHGREVRVGGGRRRALVLPELGRDLVRRDHVDTGMAAAQLRRDRPLV